MENLLECNICLEKYDNKDKIPRILKCGHTFCSKCLRELSKVNNNFERNMPFIKCPLDKTIGHSNTNIDEIPINRIIVDILDYNGFTFDKLSLKEESNEKMTYINSATEKLKVLDKFYNSNYNIIRDGMLNFMTEKNNLVREIAEHYDKMVTILENKKASYIFQIEKFSNEKMEIYNEALISLDKYREMVSYKQENLEVIKKQKLATLADEISILNSLGIEGLENKEFQNEVNKIVKEMQNEYIPKLVRKHDREGREGREAEEHLIELVNSIKVIFPSSSSPLRNIDMSIMGRQSELFILNDELENLNLSNCQIWFQQNTKNIYKKNLGETDWMMIENKENYLFGEMFRVCMIGSDEALITGGGQGFVCSNLSVLYKNGSAKKKQNMLTERRSHAMCKVGEFIYVCGGINSRSEPLNSCEKFSILTEKWLKVSNMTVAKSHLSLCNVNNQYLYSIGGENKFQSLLDIIERHTVNIDTWEVMNVKIPVKIECVACVQTKEHEFLILGGYSCELGSLNTVYSYDTVNNIIRKLNKDMDQPGWSIYMPLKYGNSIHVFFGGEEGYPPHPLEYININN